MKLKNLGILTVLFLLAILTACGNTANSSKKEEKIDLHISAAASLKDAIDEIKPLYEKKYPSTKLTFDFAGSGQIRERVTSGAPIDGVLFASESDIDKLVQAKKATSKAEFAQNTLVLIEPTSSKSKKSADLAEKLKAYQKFALGDPESVPAGKYGKETLEKLNLYDGMKDQLVLASDVRQVLSYVAAGNADAGFVYETDALISKKVSVVQSIPDDLHAPIGYYSGIVTDTEHKKNVESFMKFMRSEEAQKVLKQYGFKPGK
ncbi:molybdate ABC transporter substrate-binding protein [Listeria kieliensis]|uniref:Molybdate ABC transporter substrate-binding protein n=1 Tax=Listeria kieliensis TaxID=1621700 RepID=A0A3D8TTT2_9LIST|nr:molybdate ABC transporter substrate-binding protein [Listeria kieliensis]RDX01236.1 molybdate ABC transporter substrate-binding protein [Listeria kieliensis]